MMCHTHTPIISVLIPVYNAMPYLPEAVASVLSQTVDDIRVIIINDGSTDASQRYLVGLHDPRIRLIALTNNMGQGAARNIGLRLCTSEFTALMDADDVSLPTRFETQLRFLATNQDVGAVGSQIAYCGSTGRIGFRPYLPTEHSDIYADLLHGRHSVCHPSVMCRTELLHHVGGYRVDGSGEDWDLLLRLAETSKIANVDQVLHLYRAHSNNVNVTHIGEIRRQIAYACDCAERRLIREPEITYDRFCRSRDERRSIGRILERIDSYSLKQYRLAIAGILTGDLIAGYLRLGLASLFSPQRVALRLSRGLRHFRN